MNRSARLGLSVLLVLGLAGAVASWWTGPEAEPTGAGSPPGAHPQPATVEPPPASRAVPLAAATSATDGGFAVIEVVSAEDGSPLAGARVVVQPAASHGYHGHHGPRGFSAETDARGRVEVPPQRGESLRLYVGLDFFAEYRGPFVPGTQVVLEPLPPTHGRVLSERGEPVEGAVVTSIRQGDASTRSAADGRFTLRLPKRSRLLAEKDGAVALSPPPSDEDAAWPQGELELVLAVPESRTGRVIGRDERPLADVTVVASVQAVSWTQITGADGVFRVPDLDLLRLDMRFSKPGYVAVEQSELSAFDEEVVLSRPAHLEGQLVDQRGRPLAGQVVGLLDPASHLRTEAMRTDADGRFAFRDRGEPEVILQAITEEWAESELPVMLPEGETTTVTLALPPEREPVPVEFVSSQGEPVPGCNAVATPVPPAGWSSSSNLGVALELCAGRFAFAVRCDDGRGADETLEVRPRPDMPPLRFVVRSDAGEVFEDELPPEPVLVRVVSPTGQPVEGAEVECHTAEGVTGPDGRFRCEVRAGDGVWPLHVHATKGDARGLARATGKEPEVVVVLRSLVTLRGRVDGALPPGKLMLWVRSAAENGQEPLLGNSFALERRAAIRTFVCVERIDEAQRSSETLGCAISEAGEELVIRLGAPGRLTFSSLDRAGAPLANPIVYVDRANQLVEAPTGVVSLELPPGEHVLVLNDENSRARYEARFTVRPGEVTALGGLKLE